jgi:hypothetical protein
MEKSFGGSIDQLTRHQIILFVFSGGLNFPFVI